ncbi:MAG: Fe-S-containing protein [Candidatus Bathyarchaeia archaeon]
MVQGKNLKCDVCGAEWDVETFAGVSGGCQSYPPPKLTATATGANLEIDLSSLGTTVSA